MNFNDMTAADLAAYDRFCADLAEHGDHDGSRTNFIPLIATDSPF